MSVIREVVLKRTERQYATSRWTMDKQHQRLLLAMKSLRVDRSKGIAPHKPILLLVVLELAERNLLASPYLKLTPELAFRFAVFWSVVVHRRSQRPNIRLPFHHIGSSKLWTPLTKDGFKSPHRELTDSVAISEPFFDAMQSAEFREQAKTVLIKTYFEPNEQFGLCELAGLDPDNTNVNCVALEDDFESESRARGRSARFRVDVVAAYCHTCALTGYRITTISGSSIVDAAHIHQFADSRSDTPSNGIALCKNAHWLFDLGLWSIDDSYRVLVASELFTEACPNQEPLLKMVGKQLLLPRDERLWPSLKNIAWHRKHRFGKLS
jgi:putative restriction endonuclease